MECKTSQPKKRKKWNKKTNMLETQYHKKEENIRK